MSVAYNNKRKAKKKLRSVDVKSIARRIRSGELPKFFLTKTKEGSSTLQTEQRKVYRRGTRAKRTWRQTSTLAALTKEGT